MIETDLSRVLRKTTKGEREFSAGVRSLPQKVRGVLILVDGARSVGQIVQLLPALPVVPSIRALEAAAYVVTAHVAAAPGKPAAPAAVAVATRPSGEMAATRPAPPIDAWGDMPHWAVALRHTAIAQIEGLAGTAGAVLVQRLLRARRAGELRVEIQRAAHQLELFVGVEVARLFDEEMSERMRQAALSFDAQNV